MKLENSELLVAAQAQAHKITADTSRDLAKG